MVRPGVCRQSRGNPLVARPPGRYPGHEHPTPTAITPAWNPDTVPVCVTPPPDDPDHDCQSPERQDAATPQPPQVGERKLVRGISGIVGGFNPSPRLRRVQSDKHGVPGRHTPPPKSGLGPGEAASPRNDAGPTLLNGVFAGKTYVTVEQRVPAMPQHDTNTGRMDDQWGVRRNPEESARQGSRESPAVPVGDPMYGFTPPLMTQPSSPSFFNLISAHSPTPRDASADAAAVPPHTRPHTPSRAAASPSAARKRAPAASGAGPLRPTTPKTPTASSRAPPAGVPFAYTYVAEEEQQYRALRSADRDRLHRPSASLEIAAVLGSPRTQLPPGSPPRTPSTLARPATVSAPRERPGGLDAAVVPQLVLPELRPNSAASPTPPRGGGRWAAGSPAEKSSRYGSLKVLKALGLAGTALHTAHYNKENFGDTRQQRAGRRGGRAAASPHRRLVSPQQRPRPISYTAPFDARNQGKGATPPPTGREAAAVSGQAQPPPRTLDVGPGPLMAELPPEAEALAPQEEAGCPLSPLHATEARPRHAAVFGTKKVRTTNVDMDPMGEYAHPEPAHGFAGSMRHSYRPPGAQARQPRPPDGHESPSTRGRGGGGNGKAPRGGAAAAAAPSPKPRMESYSRWLSRMGVDPESGRVFVHDENFDETYSLSGWSTDDLLFDQSHRPATAPEPAAGARGAFTYQRILEADHEPPSSHRKLLASPRGPAPTAARPTDSPRGAAPAPRPRVLFSEDRPWTYGGAGGGGAERIASPLAAPAPARPPPGSQGGAVERRFTAHAAPEACGEAAAWVQAPAPPPWTPIGLVKSNGVGAEEGPPGPLEHGARSPRPLHGWMGQVLHELELPARPPPDE